MTPAANLDRRSPPPVPAMSIPSLLTLPRAGHPWGRPSRRRSNPPSIRTVAPRSSDNNEDFLTSLRESPKYERRDAGTAQDLSRRRPGRLDPGRGDGPRRDRALGVRRHHRAEPGSIMNVGSNGAIKRAVELGLGVTMISQDAVGEELAAGQLALLRARGTPLRRSWYVLSRKDAPLPGSAQLFLAFLRSPATASMRARWSDPSRSLGRAGSESDPRPPFDAGSPANLAW